MEEPSRVEPEASPGVCVEAVGGDAAESGPAAGRSDTASVPRATQHAENWWETLRSLLVVLVLVFGIRTFIAEATVIPTGSMENTILIGDHVFLNKLLYGPGIPYTPWRLPALRSVHRGDIIAFRYPRNPSVMYVKRVIAMGGDVVKIVNKKVYVNGRPQAEPYARYESSNLLPLRDNFPPSLAEISTLPAYWGSILGGRARCRLSSRRTACTYRRAASSPWAITATIPKTAASGALCPSPMWWASRCSSTGPTTHPPWSGPPTACPIA